MTAAEEEDLRSPLRQIATTLGLVPGGVAGFRIKYAEYVEKLRPQFPEIGTLSDNGTLKVPYLNNILNGLKGGTTVAEPVAQAPASQRTPAVQQTQAAPDAPTADATVKRRPGRKPKDTTDAQPAPVQAEETAPPARTPVSATSEEAAPAASTPQATPVRRAPGGFRKPGDVSAHQPSAPNADLSGVAAQFTDLRSRIDYIGAGLDDHAKSLKILKDVATDFETLEARFENLVTAMTWMYNQFVEGEEVDSIEEIEFEGG